MFICAHLTAWQTQESVHAETENTCVLFTRWEFSQCLLRGETSNARKEGSNQPFLQ